ncbi:hypothetical protein L6452_02071 [Arctium lappa]|uniref:Uncharacterized protein n=1 Tax=Arctium lappa TaxID=4217 RepID=A0ACB9FJ23_ARCLA|nr:hypothetical protein L6452_02071 [Arctium lappa]
MTTIGIHKAAFLIPACYGAKNHQNYQRVSTLKMMISMTMDSGSSQGTKKEEISVQLQKDSAYQLQATSQTQLQFDRLQQADQLGCTMCHRVLGRECAQGMSDKVRTWRGQRCDGKFKRYGKLEIVAVVQHRHRFKGRRERSSLLHRRGLRRLIIGVG